MAVRLGVTHAAPDAVQRAVEASEALPYLQACSHSENLVFGLEPPPAAIKDDVDAIRNDLAQALTLERFGRAHDSLAIARRAYAATERAAPA
jgi:hypothetical protein